MDKFFGFQPDFSRLFSKKTEETLKTLKKSSVPKEPPEPEIKLIPKEEYESIDISDIVELRRMLEQERFEQLNSVLDEYQNLFEKDQTDEYKIYDACGVFGLTLPSYEDLLKKWIDTTPDKYQPYLAIAQFYSAKGWESRGHRFVKDTPEEQFEKMRLFFTKAESNLKHALEINPNLMVAYKTLIGIYNANGDDESENAIIARCMELFPYSFLIKSASSWAKEPRWGGSYNEMDKIAKDAEKYSDKNQKVSILYGEKYSDQGKILKKEKQYKKALELYNMALSFGGHPFFYIKRAKLYLYDLKKYDKALEDINRSIELRPVIFENYLMRSKINLAKSNYTDSIADLHTAETIKPGNSDIQEWKKWAAEKLLSKGFDVSKKDPDKANEYFDLSREFDNDESKIHFWRGMIFANSEQYESAMSEYKAAIEINPRYFKAYRSIDYILMRDRKWDEIISYWDKFLELEPDHAQAYYERSGAHHHNKDVEKSMNDL